MTEYIISLTDYLISKHRFYSSMANVTKESEFKLAAARKLLDQDVSHMPKETLGKILCELDSTSEMDFDPSVNDEKNEYRARIFVSELLAECIYNRLAYI